MCRVWILGESKFVFMKAIKHIGWIIKRISVFYYDLFLLGLTDL